MANEHTEFWKALLRFGNSEQERRDNWNLFCIHQLKSLDVLSTSKKEDLQKKYSPVHRIARDSNQIGRLLELAQERDGPKQLPGRTIVRNFRLPISSFMDFSDDEVKDCSFAGRVFIGADFSRVKFERRVDFENSFFLDLTSFSSAFFPRAGENVFGNSFRYAEFANTVDFNNIESIFSIRFDKSIFHGCAHFNSAKFESHHDSDNCFATFDHCHFNEAAKFKDAEFGCASFTNTKFDETVCFDNASFRSKAIFSNVRFQSATSFRSTTFQCPPKFYDAELHEDTDFDGVDWRIAEKAYTHPSRSNTDSESVREKAADAVRAWDRLALIMSRLEKHAERHEFFCLKMRAQRKRDGWRLLSLANLLFDWFSGYGWDIRKAVGWWMVHMVIGAILISCGIPHSPETNWWQQFIQSLCLSFTNTHAFLGLASAGGYLHDARTGLYDVVRSDSYLDTIGACQAVLGPVFLFLVLLTLRNRFRIR